MRALVILAIVTAVGAVAALLYGLQQWGHISNTCNILTGTGVCPDEFREPAMAGFGVAIGLFLFSMMLTVGAITTAAVQRSPGQALLRTVDRAERSS
jgi:hypothetical protein